MDKTFKELLYNFWITRDDKEKYYYVKNNLNEIKNYVAKNLGSKLIIHDRFIKLEKIPTISGISNGIDNFNNILDYVILTLFLLFLEDKTRGDKFILSQLIDYIKNTALTLKLNNIPDWNKVSNRRSLITVINFLIELNVIKLKDEDKLSFIDNKDKEALYEVCGTSNYVMRVFDNDILSLKTPEEFIQSDFSNQDSEKGDIRRYRVFRNLIYTPSVMYSEIKENDIDYIKKNRGYIKQEIDKLDMDCEITLTNATIYNDINTNIKECFPNTKKITEIVLMVNKKIYDDIKNKILILNNFENIVVDDSYMKTIVSEVKKEKKPYIGKTYLSLSDDRFYEEIINYMLDYKFINKNGEDIIIYPTVLKMIGNTKDVNVEQINMFGGTNEL